MADSKLLISTPLLEPKEYLLCKRLANEQTSNWKTILLRYLKPVGGIFILCCNFDVKTLPIKLLPFYEECLKYFSECSVLNKGVQNLSAADILKTVLWNNKAICINGKSVYNHKLASIGIRKIADLIPENNELVTKHKLRELNISPLNAFRLTCVIGAIPTEWRKCLKTCQYITAEP